MRYDGTNKERSDEYTRKIPCRNHRDRDGNRRPPPWTTDRACPQGAHRIRAEATRNRHHRKILSEVIRMGWFSSNPDQDERQRDQVERGGTRASATLQAENKGDTSERIEAIK